MKKSLILLLAFLVVGALAFAAEPTAELKITTFSGNASVTLGFDIDQGMAAFTNATEVDLKIDISSAGDKSTAGENIWGELKIETDGDPIQIKTDETGVDPFLDGLHVQVDTAKLHIGTIAYVGITSDGTQLDYVDLMDEAGGFYLVDNTVFYGVLADTGDTGAVINDAVIAVPTDANAKYGVTLGITPEGIGNFMIDVRSVPQWLGDGAFQANNWGIRGKAEITAVTNLSVKVGASYSVGQTEIIGTEFTDPRDLGFGGYISYKIPLGDPMYVMPIVAVDGEYQMFDTTFTPSAVLNIEAEAGVRLGWGDKSKLSLFFSPDNDTDWGYYPGITAGIVYIDADVGDKIVGLTTDPMVGVNVSVFTGALVPNLTANAAFEIADVMADDMEMGFSANLKYDLAMDPMTITPKFGVYYYSDAAGVDATLSDIYVKAALDIAKIFPNCTLSFLYQSNDFNGGVGNVTDAENMIGMFATTFKISF